MSKKAKATKKATKKVSKKIDWKGTPGTIGHFARTLMIKSPKKETVFYIKGVKKAFPGFSFHTAKPKSYCRSYSYLDTEFH